MSHSEGSDNEEFSESHEQGDLDQELSKVELERQRIRESLSTLSFEELINLKEKLGSKVYNETVYGTKAKHTENPQGLKRVNKNRPREISSKRPCQIKALVANGINSLPKAKKNSPRDPRFDPICGEFNKEIFKKNYIFVNKIREKEKKQLEKEYKHCTDPQRKTTIKLLIQRIQNQLREEQNSNKKEQKEENERKQIKEQLKHGEKPMFKKKSVKKLEDLVEKYEELKKSNNLQKHIQKRAKKLKMRDKKNMEKKTL